MGIDWPVGWDRTAPEDRRTTNKFGAGVRQTKKELRRELKRMEADDWRLDDETGSGGNPGVVIRWTRDGADHAIACDHYTTKAANLRSCYLWLQETRMRSNRPVQTGSDEFAAARLPSQEDVIAAPSARRSPHEVLGVARDAPSGVVKAAARERLKETHPDNGGDLEEFKRVREAREALTDA